MISRFASPQVALLHHKSLYSAVRGAEQVLSCTSFELQQVWVALVLSLKGFELQKFWASKVSSCKSFGLQKFWFAKVLVCKSFDTVPVGQISENIVP